MGFEQNSGVVTKLAIFTVAMVLMPIGTYYLTRDYLFAPATTLTYPAICAVTVANLVLVAFIWVAFREDMADSERDDRQLRQREREKEALVAAAKENVDIASASSTGVLQGATGGDKTDSGTTTSRSRRRE